MRVARISAVLVIGGLLAAGCASDSEPGEPAPDQPDQTSVSMVTELEPGDARAVAEAVNEFGFDLFDEVAGAETGENTVTSPLSAAVLLAMVLAGADGDTAEAMAEVLHVEDTRDARVGALLAALTDSEDVTLSVINALWGDDQVEFEPEYLGFTQDTFDASLETADLAQPETADAIDGWVGEQTEGLITEIAEELGLPNPDAALVLLNAVYFLGEWTTEFDPADTADQPFTLGDGGQAEVPLMHLREQEFGYVERDGYRMLRLPYGEQGRYGMEIMLPEQPGELPSLLESLDATEWRSATESLAEQPVAELALPRFEAEWGDTLDDPLEQLGMGPALDPAAADFSPMSPADLFLETVVHKAFLRVDEAGTEAAAVTGGGISITSAPVGLTFRVDHPFAFTISDTETGTILFLGAITDPR